MISEVDIFNPFIGANHNRCDPSRSFSQYYKGVFSLCLVFVVRERVPFSFLCASCVKVNTFPASRADLRYIRVAGRQEIQQRQPRFHSRLTCLSNREGRKWGQEIASLICEASVYRIDWSECYPK